MEKSKERLEVLNRINEFEKENYTREELDKINVFEDVKISMDYILNKYFQ